MRQHGISLVELMIVVLLIGLLALMSAPLTSAWVSSARLGESLGALEQGVGRAKSAALRNEAGVQGEQSVSALCRSTTNELTLVVAAAGTVAACDDGLVPVWRSQLPVNAEIKVDGNNWSCSCFSNRGLVSSSAACAACSSRLSFLVSVGSENETRDFY